MELLNLMYAVVLVVVTLVTLSVYVLRRRTRQKKDTLRLELSIEERQHIPPSLHPIIDPNICIGSLSCVKACPEGDILGLVDGRALLVEASHCIGHSRCALECPVDAIKLVFGTKEKGVQLPVSNSEFESTKPGVFIVGELGGMGLIKNAITQGLQVSETIKKKKKGILAKTRDDAVDVVIVGAGPAGIATAVGLTQAGVSYRIVEQGTVGGTVANYPRGKVVMSEKVMVPGFGAFGKSLLAKEELMDAFNGMMERNNIQVQENTKVLGVDGAEGAFVVNTNAGEIKAKLVVLSTGLRGSPRKIGCPGEELSKVHYRLVDPTQFIGKRVLIVGGGDSAVEAAIQLAEETDAEIGISYRQKTFSRCKPRNRDLIAGLIEQKRVRGFMGTNVTEIHADRAHLESSSGSGRKGKIWNDYVIVSIGGELPTKFLNACGVSVREYRSEEVGGEMPPTDAETQAGRPRRERKKVKTRWLAVTLALAGVLIFSFLSWAGNDYYSLPMDARELDPMHEFLRPAGLWGHGVGIVATLFMMSNFIYVLRKRWKPLKGAAPINTWLTFHMFVGIMSPVVIAFHAAFQSLNLLASGTWVALGIVVSTGVFGRFLFGMIPSSNGKMEALSDLQGDWEKRRETLRAAMDGTSNVEQVREAVEDVTKLPDSMSLFQTITFLPRRRAKLRGVMRRIGPLFPDKAEKKFFRDEMKDIIKLRLQVEAYKRLKNFFRLWLALHVSLAVFMVLLISGHVALSLYLGYQFIFSTTTG